MTPRVGVAVTSRNRRDIFNKTISEFKRLLPDQAVLVVVDDASDDPIPEADYRFGYNAGIAAAKNKGIELLMTAGCEHLFLADDDIYPIVQDWWKPYVDGPEHYYAYTFTHWADGRPVGDCDVIFDDGVTRGLTWERGCLLYYHRSVIDAVGGMWPGFGLAMWEHVDLARRIHNAGLSTFTHQDVSDSDRLWHSLDRLCTAPRSFNRTERDQLMARNTRLAEARAHSSEYVNYRQQTNLVLSCLFTGVPDTQRSNRALAAEVNVAAIMAGSVRGAGTVILHNGLPDPHLGDTRFVSVATPKIGVYFARWLSFGQYLRSRPDITYAALLDATDTEMLNEPWPQLAAGRLYIGSEPDTVAQPWLTQHHPHPRIQLFIRENPDRQLLNPGVILGDRATLIRWCRDMTDTYFELGPPHGVGDMGVANMLAWTTWADRIEYGPHVTTVFRANEKTARAWIRHK